MRQTVVALVLASVLVLSGCTLPGFSTGPTATPAIEDVKRPPGIEDGRLADGKALMRSHNESVIQSGFESDFRVNGSNVYNGSVVEVRRRQRTLVEPGVAEFRYRSTTRGGVPPSRFTYWGNRTHMAVRAESSTSIQYETGEPKGPRLLANVIFLGYIVIGSNFSVESVERINRTVLFTLRSDEGAGLQRIVPTNATNISGYNATLVVDRKGQIRKFAASMNYSIGGERTSMDIEYLLLRIGGIDVSRPDWVSKAFDGASERRTTPSATGTDR